MYDSNKYLYKVIYNLVYEGKIVGYRLKAIADEDDIFYSYERFGENTDHFDYLEPYFDVDIDLFNMLLEDLNNSGIIHDNNAANLTLINGGKYLIPDDVDMYEPKHDVQFLTYTKFMNLPHERDSVLGYYKKKLVKCDYELKVLYNKYNKIIFDGKLPYDVPVTISDTLNRRAGECKCIRSKIGKSYEYCNFSIRLSKSYMERFSDEDSIVNVLIHEMIHVCLPGQHHNKYFMAKLNEINNRFGEQLGIHVTRFAKGLGSYNYTYACSGCDTTFERLRKIKDLDMYYCKHCKSKFYLMEDLKKGEVYDRDGHIIDYI